MALLLFELRLEPFINGGINIHEGDQQIKGSRTAGFSKS